MVTDDFDVRTIESTSRDEFETQLAKYLENIKHFTKSFRVHFSTCVDGTLVRYTALIINRY